MFHTVFFDPELTIPQISQSIRLCIIEGLHREPPSELFGDRFARHCRDIWWSAYILDRQLAAVIGCPTSIQDAQITCALPTSYDKSEDVQFMTMHIKLAKIVGQILDSELFYAHALGDWSAG